MRKIFSPTTRRGQSLYEFAITLPLLLMIMGIILDLGRLYYTYVALEDAAQEGAIYYMLNTDCPVSNSGDCSDPYNAEYRIRNATGGQEVDWDRATIDYTNSGTVVSVTITYEYNIILPFANALFEDGTFPVVVSSQIQDIVSG